MFNFFDVTPIPDPAIAEDGMLYSDPGLTFVCPVRSTIYFATSDAIIREFDREFLLVRSFTAYDEDWSVSYMKYLNGTGLLLTVAEKLGSGPVVKIWNIDKKEPEIVSTVIVTNGENTQPITCVDVSSDFSCVAIGFANGAVILVRGDMIRDRGARQRVIYETGGPVTSVHFKSDAQLLFVTTTDLVLTVSTSGRNNGKPERVLEKTQGVDLGCATYDSEKDELIVAREEGITTYNDIGRGPGFALEMKKKSIFKYKQYIVLVGTQQTTSLNTLLGSAETSRLIIVDSGNNYIAYSGQMSNSKAVIEQWNTLLFFGVDGVLYQFDEKSETDRIKILTSKNLYDLAIMLGKSLGTDEETILKIEKEYGDYLYGNNEFEKALDHYIEAILLNQTTEIILKYRESRHIRLLSQYLEALHEKNVALKEHTTLLLNSYAKLQDGENLKKLIMSIENYDYNDIQMLRQNSYFELASYLATKIKDSTLVFNIKLKDQKNYKSALNYIQTLPVDDALRILIQNSSVLLQQYPYDTLNVLIRIFTGKYYPEASPEEEEAKEIVHENDYLSKPVIQSYRAFVNYMSSSSANDDEDKREEYFKPTYQPPRPRVIFSSFVNHPHEFVIFLEACLEAYDNFNGNKKELSSTLLEMYLQMASTAETQEQKTEWQQKAMSLDQDPTTALLLSHLTGFTQIQPDLPPADMFRSATSSGDSTAAFTILKEHPDDTELYPLALAFFAGKPEFEEVLEMCKLAPLQVIQALQSVPTATVGLLKPYLISVFTSSQKKIRDNSLLTESFKKESETKKAELEKLKTKPRTIQYVKCTGCGLGLDLPAVHFGCGHSYHQRCVVENECPACRADREAIGAIRRQMEEGMEKMELFKLAVDARDEDKFGVIAEFLGKGGM